MCAFLGITTDRLKVVDILSGSVIIKSYVDSDSNNDTASDE